MALETFGRLQDGTDVPLARLQADGLSVGILAYGAAIRDIAFAPAGPRSLVLGLTSLDDYVQHSPHMGAVAGRYANRIRHGRFRLDGREIQLALKPGSPHHLHGGVAGFSRRPWRVVAEDGRSVALEIHSPDGDEGYPGAVTASCTYAISGEGVLRIELTATTDAPTIVNLATHSYFNLDGEGDILDHVLEIPAEAYTPVDDLLIPTGEIRAVAGTPYDFRRARPVRLVEHGERVWYDHNFVVTRAPTPEPHPIARLTGRSGVTLEIHSTEPGVQFYDGAKVAVPVEGLDHRRYGANAGLCLEPQKFPDTPNNPSFGSAALRPGEVYRQVTEYRFSKG